MENLIKQGQPKWLPGTIIERMGSVMYCVHVGEQIWRRLADQVRAREEMGMAIKEKDTQIDDNNATFPTSTVATTKSANSSTEPSYTPQILCPHHRVNFKTMKKLLQSCCQVYPDAINILTNYLTV